MYFSNILNNLGAILGWWLIWCLVIMSPSEAYFTQASEGRKELLYNKTHFYMNLGILCGHSGSWNLVLTFSLSCVLRGRLGPIS